MSWNGESNGFIVTNVKKLERDILPVYFKHNNLDSFTRQLNTYGFRKIRSKASVEYKHELFVKDRLDLINSIRRRPSERIMPESRLTRLKCRLQRLKIKSGDLECLALAAFPVKKLKIIDDQTSRLLKTAVDAYTGERPLGTLTEHLMSELSQATK